MFMGNTFATATPTPVGMSTGVLADHLEALAGGLEARFRGVGELLAEAIGTIDGMAAGLDDIRRALSPEAAGEAIAKLRGAAARLSALPTIQRQRAAEIDRLTTRTRDLRALLGDVGHILHLLGIYGMNIKIASSGETAFFDFVTGMDGKLDSGRRQLRHFGKELDQFSRVMRDVTEADRRLTRECGKVGMLVPEELTRNADALQEHVAAVIRMADTVAVTMKTVQSEVTRILAAIQIGDSVRQRVEHGIALLRRITAEGEAMPAGARRHLSALAGAQLRGIAGDFRQEVAALVEALERLGPLAVRLMGMIETQAGGRGDDDDHILAQLERGIANMSDVTDELCSADRQLATLSEFVERTLDDLMQGLTRFQRIAVDVQDISTNTRLLCRRHGAVGRAVAVVATEVAPCATRLDRLSADVGGVIAGLNGVDLTAGDGPASGDTGAILNDALAVVRGACATSDAAVANGSGRVQSIVAALGRSAADLAGEQAFVQALEAAADVLGHGGAARADRLDEADTIALHALLPWASSLYTMAREREIHAPFLLPGMTVPVAAPVAMDEDDDGLF